MTHPTRSFYVPISDCHHHIEFLSILTKGECETLQEFKIVFLFQLETERWQCTEGNYGRSMYMTITSYQITSYRFEAEIAKITSDIGFIQRTVTLIIDIDTEFKFKSTCSNMNSYQIWFSNKVSIKVMNKSNVLTIEDWGIIIENLYRTLNCCNFPISHTLWWNVWNDGLINKSVFAPGKKLSGWPKWRRSKNS